MNDSNTPQPQAPTNDPWTSDWKWWAGHDEEWMQVGPCDTADQAVEEAVSDELGFDYDATSGFNKCTFYLCEARSDPLRLSDWIDVEDILERAEERISDSDRVGCEADEGPFFECTPEQKQELVDAVRDVVDRWQLSHDLKFSCLTFSHTRGGEWRTVVLTEENKGVK